MIKIVVTVVDYGAAANIGGPVDSKSAIIDIPTKNIPKILRDYLSDLEKLESGQWKNIWKSVSFSLLDESEGEG